MILVKMAQITPPVGFNLFVLQDLTGRDTLFIAKAAMPFFFLMRLGVIIIASHSGAAVLADASDGWPLLQLA